jgi:predicted ATP-grasp superfamily ATP-dependent carboligase
VDSPTDIEQCMDLRFPVVARPVSWSAAGGRYFKIQVSRSPDQLETSLLLALSMGATLIVQEYLEVEDHQVEFAIVWRSADRSMTVACTGRKLGQSTPEGGVMVWGKSEDLPDVREQAYGFLDESDFLGLGGIEFIRTEGQLHFVEFNPRLEAIHFLATRAGVDTVSMAYQDLALDVMPSQPPPQRRATAWVGSAWAQRITADRRSVWPLLRDRLRFAVAPNRVRAIWSWSDPLPSLAVARRLLLASARSVIRLTARRKPKNR